MTKKEKLEKAIEGLANNMPENPEDVGIGRITAIELHRIADAIEIIAKVMHEKEMSRKQDKV